MLCCHRHNSSLDAGWPFPSNSPCISRNQAYCHYRQKKPTKSQLKAMEAYQEGISSGANRPMGLEQTTTAWDMVATARARSTSDLSSAISLKRYVVAVLYPRQLCGPSEMPVYRWFGFSTPTNNLHLMRLRKQRWLAAATTVVWDCVFVAIRPHHHSETTIQLRNKSAVPLDPRRQVQCRLDEAIVAGDWMRVCSGAGR